MTIKVAKTPIVLQMEATECGAASLGIIMGYYQKFVPLEELRAECGVSRDGSKAINVVRAARKYGFNANGSRREVEELANLKAPFIVFWNFNHFLVVEGIVGDKVFLNDPAVGPRQVTLKEFDQAFTGIVLEFSPTAEFKASGKPMSVVANIKHRLQGNYTSIIYLLIIGVVLAIPGLVFPALIKTLIDNCLITKNYFWYQPLLFVIGLSTLVACVLSWLRDYYLVKLESKLSIATSSQFFWHILRLPMDFFAQRSIGDISSRVSLNESVAQIVTGEIFRSILNVIVVFFYLFIMVYYDVKLTLASIIICTLCVIATKMIHEVRKVASYRVSAENGKVIGAFYNGIASIESIKASGRVIDFFAKLTGYQTRANNVSARMQTDSIFLSSIPAMLILANTAIILTIGGVEIIHGLISIGTLIAFQALAAIFFAPIRELINTSNNIQTITGDISRLDDVAKYPALIPSQPIKVVNPKWPNDKLIGKIELRNLSFGYSKLSNPLIENFNLTIMPGTKVAIIGSSGSGKSTIAKLISQLFQPWSGEIYFDDVKADISLRSILVNSLSMVDQNIQLFEGTIRNNISMWDTSIADKDIIQAAKDACIHDVILQKEQGYEGIVKEGGTNFSGGQAQRIEIARALINHPSILICDEATSALDPITELEIQNNLRRLGCTTVIIAHRLSTIRDSDEIIVLDNGKIAQQGTHDTLMQDSSGMYYKLVKLAS